MSDLEERLEMARAEGAAQGAAQERADILWWLNAAPPTCTTLADAAAIIRARGGAPKFPCPACVTEVEGAAHTRAFGCRFDARGDLEGAPK